jgi:serine/threonine protein phosphatase PrpC
LAELNEKLAAGEITQEQVDNDPQKFHITSAVMEGEIDKIDCSQIPIDLQTDDVIIVASDGIEILSLRLYKHCR